MYGKKHVFACGESNEDALVDISQSLYFLTFLSEPPLPQFLSIVEGSDSNASLTIADWIRGRYLTQARPVKFNPIFFYFILTDCSSILLSEM